VSLIGIGDVARRTVSPYLACRGVVPLGLASGYIDAFNRRDAGATELDPKAAGLIHS
jgi:hypothetical protein